jgi:hypothetical protein
MTQASETLERRQGRKPKEWAVCVEKEKSGS